MILSDSPSRKIFNVINILFLAFISLLCLLPFVNILAISFSSKTAAAIGSVSFWPVDSTFAAYAYVLQKPEFFKAFFITIERVVLGASISMFFLIITAYPLSKETNQLRIRTIYAWYFVLTMLFSSGLIPYFMVIRDLGLLNTIWVLVLPSSLQIFNLLVLLNFFRGLPKELEESAFIDGATHWTILWKIFYPLSKPALATVLLFTIVHHWNSWFDGIIFMDSKNNYPLQTYLQTLVVQSQTLIQSADDVERFQLISDRTVKSAQIFLGSLPILLIYPFLQRYFMSGLVLGSVKE